MPMLAEDSPNPDEAEMAAPRWHDVWLSRIMSAVVWFWALELIWNT